MDILKKVWCDCVRCIAWDEALGGYFCGFNVDAFDDCRKYVTIMQSVAEYIFYMLYRDKCRCNKQTKAILMCVSCRDNATTCTHADTVHDDIRYTRTTVYDVYGYRKNYNYSTFVRTMLAVTNYRWLK